MDAILLAYSAYLPFTAFVCIFAFSSSYRIYALRIASLSTILYGLFAYLCYNINLHNANLVPSDQWSFWTICENLSNLPSLKSVFETGFVEKNYGGNEGFKFLIGAIGYIANNYADGNSWLLQMIVVSFFAAHIPLFVYKLLSYYVPVREAWHYALLYLLCSFSLSYSGFLLRDSHIALMYIVMLVLIHGNFKIRKLILQLALITLIYTFRPESAIGVLPLLLLYTFYSPITGGRTHFIVYTTRILIIIFTFIYGSFLLNAIKSSTELIASYTEMRSDFMGDGIAASIYSLPLGIREISVFLYSIIFPFPCWAYFPLASTFSDYIYIFFSSTIQPIFWTIIMYMLGRHLLCHSERYQIPTFLKFLLIFFMAFILVNTSNMTPRRLYAVYPIAYTAWVWFQVNTPHKLNIRYSRQAIGLYATISLLYIILKVF